MSLNWSINASLARKLKFATNVSQLNEDGSTIDLQLPNVGLNNQVLSSSGDGTVRWKNDEGVTNPLTISLYPANANIDLGSQLAPFRKLYVQHQTLELVNSADNTKSGSLSIENGNIQLKSNLPTANVSLGNNAGTNSAENCTNIGNDTGENCLENVVNVGYQAGKQNCLENSVNIGTGSGLGKSGAHSISIGTLAGSAVLGGLNGTNSICIGESAGQNDCADNSIILNATGNPLDTTISGCLIVKPIRDLPTYTKVLAYDDVTGEIFSSIVTTPSGGGSSNIYLYNNSTDLLPPPNNGQIRYNASQTSATELYVSHRTRDTIDIDAFLEQISTVDIIYIQDQENSLNYIKYNVTGAVVIIPNDFVTIPVSYLIAEGNGLTSFGNGHNIFMSIFTNTPAIDTRLTQLETKTQNQSAILLDTTFTGNIKTDTINNKYFKDNGIPTNFLISGQDNQCLGVGNISIGLDNMNNSTASSNVSIGCNTLEFVSIGSRNCAYGGLALRNCDSGDGNVAVGFASMINNVSGSENTAIGNNAGGGVTNLMNTISIGSSASATMSNQCVIGSGITEVLTSGIFNGAGFKIGSTGLSTDLLTADGSINSTALTDITILQTKTQNQTASSGITTFTGHLVGDNIKIPTGTASQILLANGSVNSTLLDIVNWRFQSFGYYGSVPTASNIDSASGWMLNLGGSLALQTVLTTNIRTLKYRVQSNVSSVGNGAVCGWLGTTISPPIYIRQGFKVVIGFGLGDTTTNASTRSMVGLFQSSTAPVLNNTATIASITTQSIGIIQESGENAWSFNTRGASSSTTTLTTIPCTTPSTTWFILEIINRVNSNDIVMTLYNTELNTSATQTYTAGSPSTASISNQCYIQLQRNMSSAGGLTGSAILQTASFRMWSAC